MPSREFTRAHRARSPVWRATWRALDAAGGWGLEDRADDPRL